MIGKVSDSESDNGRRHEDEGRKTRRAWRRVEGGGPVGGGKVEERKKGIIRREKKRKRFRKQCRSGKVEEKEEGRSGVRARTGE